MATAKKTAAANDTLETLAGVNTGAVKEGYEKFAKGMSTITDFQKGSLEAAMASAGALAKGLEKAASEQSAFLKASYEEGVAAAKAAAASKSAQEALDLHSDYLRSAFEKNLGQINKMADLWLATTKEVADPLTERYSEFVELAQSYRP